VNPSEDEVAREMERLAKATPEELDPDRVALMRALWRNCITNQTAQSSGPATDLLATGVSDEALLKVIRKAALESLIAALVTLDNAEVTSGLAESVSLVTRPRWTGGPSTTSPHWAWPRASCTPGISTSALKADVRPTSYSLSSSALVGAPAAHPRGEVHRRRQRDLERPQTPGVSVSRIYTTRLICCRTYCSVMSK
jgi:hypothetical protein